MENKDIAETTGDLKAAIMTLNGVISRVLERVEDLERKVIVLQRPATIKKK